jgi:hypothetical protein
MFGSDMLDVAVGMIFTYLLLSLICSAANELIERSAKNRAASLQEGLKELLDDQGGTGLVKQLYNHGMINGLFKGAYDPAKSLGNLPSYIPARNFTLAILGIIAPGGVGSPSSFKEAVGKIQSESVKSAFLSMIDDSGQDLGKLHQNVEDWFNSTMDRVSGWYKRRTQLFIFLLGLTIAVGLNVNSVTLANDLWSHKAQRDALVSAAQGYLEKHHGADSAAPATALEAAKLGTADTTKVQELDPSLKADIEHLDNLGLPIGWKNIRGTDIRNVPFLAWSFVGWLITAFAVSLGAPFWFDVLNKFVVVRSTIKPHEKSQEETSKN